MGEALRVRQIEIKNFRGIQSLVWRVRGDFNCIIGPGDACKTTILTALDYALTSRQSIAFDDADFFNQNVEQPIVIQVTLAEWSEQDPDIAKFFREGNFGQFKCGLDDTGPLAEPIDGGITAVSVSLRVDKTLEPKWSVVKGRDEGEETVRKVIYASDRAVLGVSRIDISSDAHFAWGRNTLLTRLSGDSRVDIGGILSDLARTARQSDVSGNGSVAGCQTIAGTVRQESINIGVKLAELSPKLDIQRHSMNTGALALHEGDVPLRNKGSGSKKLVSYAMQMKLHDGKNVSLIDEIEIGLEPHRIRGLLYKLKKSGQQIFTTTHSPVVVRELQISGNELHVCKCDSGRVSLESLANVSDIQGPVRTNAEAFLGRKIIACEGLTEIGLLRAYDIYRFDANNPPVWTLSTAYFNCSGASKLKTNGPQLFALGYKVAGLCDNDAPDQLSAEDITSLQSTGIHICQWEVGNSTEAQLFNELPWQYLNSLLTKICDVHDTLEYASAINEIKQMASVSGQALADDVSEWIDSPALRAIISKVAHKDNWFRRIHDATEVFNFVLPLLPATGVMHTRLGQLWSWVQNDG